MHSLQRETAGKAPDLGELIIGAALHKRESLALAKLTLKLHVNTNFRGLLNVYLHHE